MSECIEPSPGELSVSKTFTTVELLEPILLYLDMRCLLTSALRVCRQWRDLIQGSISLQRALFFECEESPSGSHEVTFNPLLVELFPLLFDPAGTPRGFDDLAIEALPIGRRRVAYYRLNASWRHMHLRRPPVRHVALWTLDKIHRRKEKMKMVRYDGGLRMENFYFLVLKHVFWWDLFVKWGATQGRQLCHFKYVRMHMRESAEGMVRTADVTIGAIADDDCVVKGNARDFRGGNRRDAMEPGRTLGDNHCVGEEKNGLVKLGILWFKVKGDNGWELVWEKEDDSSCYWVFINRAERPYIWAHDYETNTDKRLAII